MNLILSGLQTNTNLQILNISKNIITDKISFHLSNLIKYNINLRELYLHWNKITEIGGI